MIRMLDHTADVGFELEASSLEALFEEAHRALLVILLENPPAGDGEERVVRIPAPDRETLLVRWLNELVYLVQDTAFVPASARVEITGGDDGPGFELGAVLAGAPLDIEAHGFQGEVKSATFHGLEVTGGDGGWRARVILDV